MRYRANILRLLLVALLVFTNSVQAWMMPPLPQHTPESAMPMESMAEHCQSQLTTEHESSCQQGFCCMCISGITSQNRSAAIPSTQVLLATEPLHSTDLQTSELYRPPRVPF